MSHHETIKYYKKIEEKEKIVCLLCRHYCQLGEGKVGICGVNKNVNGELKTLVYGHPVALHVDPIEKKPLYHFLPVAQPSLLAQLDVILNAHFVKIGIFPKSIASMKRLMLALKKW